MNPRTAPTTGMRVAAIASALHGLVNLWGAVLLVRQAVEGAGALSPLLAAASAAAGGLLLLSAAATWRVRPMARPAALAAGGIIVAVGILAGMAGLRFGFVYGLVLLYLYNRPDWRSAFARRRAGAAPAAPRW
jgi:hypothetical protein